MIARNLSRRDVVEQWLLELAGPELVALVERECSVDNCRAYGFADVMSRLEIIAAVEGHERVGAALRVADLYWVGSARTTAQTRFPAPVMPVDPGMSPG